MVLIHAFSPPALAVLLALAFGMQHPRVAESAPSFGFWPHAKATLEVEVEGAAAVVVADAINVEQLRQSAKVTTTTRTSTAPPLAATNAAAASSATESAAAMATVAVKAMLPPSPPTTPTTALTTTALPVPLNSPPVRVKQLSGVLQEDEVLKRSRREIVSTSYPFFKRLTDHSVRTLAISPALQRLDEPLSSTKNRFLLPWPDPRGHDP